MKMPCVVLLAASLCLLVLDIAAQGTAEEGPIVGLYEGEGSPVTPTIYCKFCTAALSWYSWLQSCWVLASQTALEEISEFRLKLDLISSSFSEFSIYRV